MALARPASASEDSVALRFALGYASATGQRERNEDFVGAVTPQAAELAAKGVLAAVADGVSGGSGGREAAEYAVRSLLSDYYATPVTWSVPASLERVIAAVNRWLVSQAGAGSQHEIMATTLSALVLRGNRYYIAHVGDSRVYRLRGSDCAQLTEDHVWDRPDMQHVLRRAVGLDARLAVDYLDGELQAGDCFVLCTDGVWEPSEPRSIRRIVTEREDPQAAAQALVDEALSRGGRDNATALVLRVAQVSPGTWRDLLGDGLRLPVPPRLRPGSRIDEFEIVELLHESRATLLYRARSLHTGALYALKTLQPALADDSASCEGLLAEEWLAKRLVAPQFAQVLPLDAGARHQLYYAMSYHAGASLQQQLDQGRHFSVPEVVRIGMQLARGLGALHRLSVVHRDIKPGNLLQAEGGELKILDLGVAFAAGVPYPELEGNPGTPSFMAPELFAGEAGAPAADLYAAGVTLYHLLTRRYPYGEIEPFQTPRFGDPVPPTRYRPELPRWLENVLLRAVARDRAHRFETAEELRLALERGDANAASAPPHTPLLQRPVARWQAAALVLLIVNLLLLYLLLVR
jgi:protein phosphatase